MTAEGHETATRRDRRSFMIPASKRFCSNRSCRTVVSDTRIRHSCTVRHAARQLFGGPCGGAMAQIGEKGLFAQVLHGGNAGSMVSPGAWRVGPEFWLKS